MNSFELSFTNVDGYDVSLQASISNEHTLAWFWRERFRPMKEPTRKESARSRMAGIIKNYVVKPFGQMPLGKLDRFTLQAHFNKMAERFSGSICQKFRVWTKTMLDEAVALVATDGSRIRGRTRCNSR